MSKSTLPPGPLQLLHEQIYAAIQESNAVKLAVSNYKHNIISGMESRVQELDVLSTTDMPELFLHTTNTTGAVMTASSCCNFEHVIDVRITTGDNRVDILYPIIWSLLCCLTELCYGDRLRLLEWYNQPFVMSSELAETSHNLEGDPERSVAGYVSLFSITNALTFSRESLIRFNRGENPK